MASPNTFGALASAGFNSLPFSSTHLVIISWILDTSTGLGSSPFTPPLNSGTSCVGEFGVFAPPLNSGKISWVSGSPLTPPANSGTSWIGESGAFTPPLNSGFSEVSGSPFAYANTNLSREISWLTFVSGSVIVTFPFESTVTSFPGFAFVTFSFTLSCSSGLKFSGFFTGTFSIGTTGLKSSGFTVIVTSISSVLLSGYVTVTTPSLFPCLEVSGIRPSFHSNVVPSGKSLTLFTLSFANGTWSCSTVCAFGCGLYSSFCGVTSTVTVTSSVLLSG